MDCPLPDVRDDADFPWSDSHSLDSDDGVSVRMPGSPSWMDSMPTTSSASVSASSTSSQPHHAGWLSPISNGIDIPGTVADRGTCPSTASSASMAPTMINSASSSCTDSWGIGFEDGEDVNAGNPDNDIHWEQDSDDVLTVPKLEPLEEDDFRMDDLKEAPMTPVPDNSVPTLAQPKVKRPRGRPRKHPLTPVVGAGKVTKGRSKTGCITCRKRKKKCDEAKPRCMNCEKNAVVCEGYPEKQIWKSGRERAEEERLKGNTQGSPVITMQPIFNGLETMEDMISWKHYNDTLSTVLTVEGERKNAFRDMLIPIATKHQGLMHSILALSSKHLDCETPYGVNLLRKYPSTSVEALQARSGYHHEKAMEKLYEDIAKQEDKDEPDHKLILSARYGQMLCLLLESLAEGNPRGEHRVHLQAYQTLIKHSPPEDPAFLTFITEFFQYHIYADELICYPGVHIQRLAAQDWSPKTPIHPPRLLGVADGLFKCLSQITSIRNAIRANMANQTDPIVGYTHLYKAVEIDNAIKEWVSNWPAGDSRDRVGLLYKQMMWIYLFRTIHPPLTTTAGFNSNTNSTSSAALSMMPPVGMDLAAASANTPPHSTPASCASSPSPRAAPISIIPNNIRRHSIAHPQTAIPVSRRHSIAHPQGQSTPSGFVTPRTPTGASQPTERPDSPPPIRLPPGHDNRITLAVEESLTILESFTAGDPAQTLLLIPCLVVGTACFAPAQQQRIRDAVRTVRGYTGLRNTDRVTEVLEELWRLMQAGDWVRVWDWQGIARDLNMDFLCA